MARPQIFFITGISGSGKTSVARKLKELGFIAFDSKTDKGIFRFADENGDEAPDYRPNDKDWIQKYKWVLNTSMLNDLLKKHSTAEKVFLCGRGNIRQHWGIAEKVFLLKINGETLMKRLNSPSRDNDFAKDQPTQQKLLGDLDFVQKSLSNAGAVSIDAEQPLGQVVKDILEQV